MNLGFILSITISNRKQTKKRLIVLSIDPTDTLRLDAFPYPSVISWFQVDVQWSKFFEISIGGGR